MNEIRLSTAVVVSTKIANECIFFDQITKYTFVSRKFHPENFFMSTNLVSLNNGII